MIALIPWRKIAVPKPNKPETYSVNLEGQSFSFTGLKALLGAADFSKAGDRNAGLAAKDEVAREAARKILSGLSLQHLYDNPLTDQNGQVDSVMAVNYAIDHRTFSEIANLTVGDLKNALLKEKGPRLKEIGAALTGVMAAAVAKLMDTHELICVARKIQRPTKARTTVGLPGTLSSRLQPNHPTDDLQGVSLLTYWGLSMGAGDALLGLNPAEDTVENVSTLLRHLDRLRRETGVPSQVCVLSHIKTQLACLKQGAPVEILFQSLAGTDATNGEFDITVELLDEAFHTMKTEGPLKDQADQFLYFETGQGSELTYGKHNGMDMTTTEALCYGLARRYDPFLVNNVTGFIGPETHVNNEEMILANLQDHFMGKLMGLPMGMAPCYTLHSKITLEGQQIAAELLAAAGANYYMDVCLNTDRMLAYFDTSSHDDQTMREIYGRRPTPEYTEWAIEKGIFIEGPEGLERGPHWGDPTIFCDAATLETLRQTTPSVPGFDSAGSRPTNAITREIRFHQAVARKAIWRELDPGVLAAAGDFRFIQTMARDKESHLNDPNLGATLSGSPFAQENAEVQILVSDGLSAEAVHHNLGTLLPPILGGLELQDHSVGQLIAVPYGRVKLAEPVLLATGARCACLLIGERPGGNVQASRSLSAYLVYRIEPEVRADAVTFSGHSDIRFEYTVISNIYPEGLAPDKAGKLIAERIDQILTHQAAGNRLEAKLETFGTRPRERFPLSQAADYLSPAGA